MNFTKIENIILEHKFISDLQLLRDKMYVYTHTQNTIIYGNRIVFYHLYGYITLCIYIMINFKVFS